MLQFEVQGKAELSAGSNTTVGRMGCELELICWTNEGPVKNPDQLLPNGGEFGPDIGMITKDAGIGCVELVTRPHRTISELVENLRELEHRLPSEWKCSYVPLNSHLEKLAGEQMWNDDHRYKALIAAVRQECPDSWEHVYNMARWCATQFTLEIDPLSGAGHNLMQFLNLIAPFLCHAICCNYGIDNRRHHFAWTKFASPDRLPAYRWFSESENFVLFFEKQRALIKCVDEENDQWEPDLEAFQKIGDRVHEGTCWHFARPKRSLRNEEKGCPGCIEFRPLPSMKIENVERAATLVLDLCNAFLAEVGSAWLPTVHSVEPALKKLAAYPEFHGFIPATVPTEAQWMSYFNR